VHMPHLVTQLLAKAEIVMEAGRLPGGPRSVALHVSFVICSCHTAVEHRGGCDYEFSD
jgi:hypothetical protein